MKLHVKKIIDRASWKTQQNNQKYYLIGALFLFTEKYGDKVKAVSYTHLHWCCYKTIYIRKKEKTCTSRKRN